MVGGGTGLTGALWAALLAGLWFLAGAAIEVFNAWTRRWAAARLSPGGMRARSVGWFVGGFFVRVVLTAGVLVLALRHSFVSGIAAFAGYYLCRTVLAWRLARRLDRPRGEGSSLWWM